MKEYKLFGADTKLSVSAQLIMEQDVDELERTRDQTWSVNEQLHVCDYIDEFPINLALIENKLEVVDYFLGLECNLNQKGSPSFVNACKNCTEETLQKLIEHGARIDLTDNVGKNAYSSALYSERYELLQFILDNGLPIDSDGGSSFRQAVYDQQKEAVLFFLNNGIDPNIRTPDMVMPNNPTAVAVATTRNDIEIVKLLIRYGADITLADEYGERPFLIAKNNNFDDLSLLLRELEPEELQNLESYIELLEAYKMPKSMIKFLKTQDNKIEVGITDCQFIKFNEVTEVKEINWEGRKCIDLLKEVDNYWEQGFLVWSATHKKLAFADFEHNEFHLLCSWRDFTNDPSKWVTKITSYDF